MHYPCTSPGARITTTLQWRRQQREPIMSIIQCVPWTGLKFQIQMVKTKTMKALVQTKEKKTAVLTLTWSANNEWQLITWNGNRDDVGTVETTTDAVGKPGTMKNLTCWRRAQWKLRWSLGQQEWTLNSTRIYWWRWGNAEWTQW